MADLRGRQIRESYRFLVGLSARTTANSVFGVGMEPQQRFITDGDGVRSALRIGTTGISINGNAVVSGTLTVQTNLIVSGQTTLLGTFNVDSVSAGGSIAAASFNATSTVVGGFRGIDTDSSLVPSFTWDGSPTTGMFRSNDGGVAFTFNADEKLRIINNVVQQRGTDPRYRFVDVDAPVTHQWTELLRQNSTFNVRTLDGNNNVQAIDYSMNIGASGATNHIFRVVGLDAARVDAVGTTAPTTTTIMTREKGDSRYAQLAAATNTYTGKAIYNSGTLNNHIRLERGSGTAVEITPSVGSLLISVSGAESARIAKNGPLVYDNAQPSFTVITREKGDARYTQISSDENLKENIIDAVSALPILTQLRPVMYNFKADVSAKQHFGLIAQEVQAVLPNAVLQGGDGLGLELRDLVGLLIKANQELNTKLNLALSEIEILKNNT